MQGFADVPIGATEIFIPCCLYTCMYVHTAAAAGGVVVVVRPCLALHHLFGAAFMS